MVLVSELSNECTDFAMMVLCLLLFFETVKIQFAFKYLIIIVHLIYLLYYIIQKTIYLINFTSAYNFCLSFV